MYTDGKQLNNQLFSDIKKAKHYVHISFFSIADDKVSHQFLDLLRQKSQEGVEVYYAVDRLGGILLKKKERELLVKKGVHFTYYNKPAFPYLSASLDHRNHRRISVIDGRIGYIGGFNIGKKYLGEKAKLGHWRDYHLQIRGEGVQDLEQQFVLDWKKTQRNRFRYTVRQRKREQPRIDLLHITAEKNLGKIMQGCFNKQKSPSL